MIWDLHCHLNGVSGRTPHERMAHLIELADRMGIDRMCLYMGMQFESDPSPEQIRQQNDEALQALEHWRHRAFGFVYLNPNHLEFSLREFDRCVRDGPMVGVKLWTARRASDAELDPIIERAAAAKAVIFQHTWLKVGGNVPGESTPMELAELARRHPAVPIICGHTGGVWEMGIRAIRDVNNLYSDISGTDPTAGYVEMAVREIGADRVIYGSGVGGRSFASQLGKVMGARIAGAARDQILAGNLRRLILPILMAKGVRL